MDKDNSMTTPDDVIAFWMEAGPARWFAKSDVFDDAIRARFGTSVAAAREGRLDGWVETREGRLALVILLDQFSRNIHRGSPFAFSGDAKALATARQAIAAGDFAALPVQQAQWLMLPFEHHEGLAEQDQAVALCEQLGDAELIKYAKIHRDIIRQFGRFPHRNAILERVTTPEEQAFLDEGGFAG
jgi:uncharacterized protein (DUF924 family)